MVERDILFGDLTALFYLLSGFAVETPPPGFVVTAFDRRLCLRQGARAFEGRAPLWLPVLGTPALWLACLTRDFIENPDCRVVLVVASARAIACHDSSRVPARPAGEVAPAGQELLKVNYK